MRHYYEVIFCWIKFHYHYISKPIKIEEYPTGNNIHKFAIFEMVSIKEPVDLATRNQTLVE